MATQGDSEPEHEVTSDEETEYESDSDGIDKQQVSPNQPPKQDTSKKELIFTSSEGRMSESGNTEASSQESPSVNPAVVVQKPNRINQGSTAYSSKATGSKRGAKTAGFSVKDGKKSKKKTDTVNHSEKASFEGTLSDNDELIILNGMVDYMEVKKINPRSDISAFHDFVQGKLQVKISKSELKKKIKEMKHKFEDLEKTNEGNVFTNPHEKKVYKLSNIIWGKGNMIITSEDNQNLKVSENNNAVKPVDGAKYSVDLDPMQYLNLCYIAGARNEEVRAMIKRYGAEMFEGEGAVNGSLEWKKLKLEETKLYSENLAMQIDKANMILTSLKNKNKN